MLSLSELVWSFFMKARASSNYCCQLSIYSVFNEDLHGLTAPLFDSGRGSVL
jgi:hypothetical protein